MKIFITTDAEQTKELGELLAEEIKGGKIICLEGELGSGKTTFTQGLLKGLGIKDPYTSPTFVVMKHYKRKLKGRKLLTKIRGGVQDIYHIDAYRVTAKNVLDIGWEEIVADKNNIIIIEWANKIKKIIPQKSLWIKLKLVNPSHAIPAESRRTEASENKREIILLSK